jgi:hypothetical protein
VFIVVVFLLTGRFFMKLVTTAAAACGLLMSGLAASVANASLVAAFTSGASTVTLNGTLDSSGQNYQINADSVAVGDFTILGFSASSNSPSAPADGQVPLEKAGAAFVAVNHSSTFETLTINLVDNGFTSSISSEQAVLTGAASVTFYGNPVAEAQQPDYFQYASSANGTSVSSATVDYSAYTNGSLATENAAVGPVDFALNSVYSMGSTLTLGLNPFDSATLTFQTDPSPVALPLPGTSVMLGFGLAGLAGMAMLRRRSCAR